MNKFEQSDMDWLKHIIDPDDREPYRTSDVMLSNGRAERIINHIEQLQAQVDAYKQALHDAWAIKGEDDGND